MAYENVWCVAGFSQENISDIMRKIAQENGKTIIRERKGIGIHEITFDDGVVLKWLPQRETHGIRFGKLYCDEYINTYFFDWVILPMYMEKKEDIVWI